MRRKRDYILREFMFLHQSILLCSVASEIDESSVMQLAEMGFPLEACRKAVYFTGNMGAEVAFNWIIVHMEEPGEWSEEGVVLESDGLLSDAKPWSFHVL